jgi:hypothetical protein
MTMKGRKLFAVYLLLAIAGVCFISAPAFADSPWDADGGSDDSSTNTVGERGDDRPVGTGLSQSSGWTPVPQTNFGMTVFLFTYDHFISHNPTVQQEQTSVYERSKASRPWLTAFLQR